MNQTESIKISLKNYNNHGYNPGKGFMVRALWYLVNIFFFLNPLCISIGFKVFLLKLFGGRVGKGVVIKPRVNIKYPWNIEIGDHVWIGEKVWIDSLGPVKIENNVCISQGAILVCGNHDYTKSTFDLMISEIHLEEGVWIGVGAIAGPGTHAQNHSVLTAGSVASGKLEPYSIYRGNPAILNKQRRISE